MYLMKVCYFPFTLWSSLDKPDCLFIGRLVLKKTCFFCVGEYAEYGFDQQRLIWYVFRLWDMVFSLDDKLKKIITQRQARWNMGGQKNY